MRKAINEKCKECIYDNYQPGSWREQVYQCTSGNCPLFPLRPVPEARKPKAEISRPVLPTKRRPDGRFIKLGAESPGDVVVIDD